MTHVIVGEDINRFRLKVILSALRLECKGLKGRTKASVIARDILKNENIIPEKILSKLYDQFKDYVSSKEQSN